ncbi:Methylenetetrahydrofolate reductase 2 [Wickerhamiella sorbophila]|uniref:Methylenetetrahydrofolate reductase 2 n=1 Tax=Wickerhamiella sorbophila TaxID=45607 RepID=A0A2T0FGM1_9ASCO|nr:Methylenetetrahydrofolate reductase 2 [Wickerhamiella sorbophila]PRT54136.1 Methylenetetrahydrofolate reductase 2 [Wickerhamiella sorbophila]
MKISQKLERYHQEAPNDGASISFEYFVPKTSQGISNLYDRMDRMYKLDPLFVDVTWNAGGSQSNFTTEMIHTAQNVIGVDTCMHLTCTGMPVEVVDQALEEAHKANCHNILALRGDPPRVVPGEEKPITHFRYAKDLIKHIRDKYGDYFDIGVAGYPEGHPEEPDADVLIEYLKEKVDAGASFVITQMFYDVDLFLNWVDRCRAAGIYVPIIPGIMPISGWASFNRRAKWCQVNVPPQFLAELEPISNDDAAVREKGSQLVANMCAKMIAHGISHLHFYTMNLERATIMVLEQLHMLDKNNEKRPSPLPWRQSLGKGRESESVRPIFWRNRKHSYVSRTADWDEFPNGRWGDSRSPAYGELERYGVLLRQSTQKAIELWGSPKSLEDLGQVISKYLSGKLPCLPWSDDPVGAEISVIREKLLDLNSRGFLTINSQPAVNGVHSSDPIHGWGPKKGYVYQKAYLELLVPKERFEHIKPKLDSDEYVTYYATCFRGCHVTTNASSDEPNAVTWGIFPGQEVQQPTIVERGSFLAWKDEAFRLAFEWAACQPKDSDSYKFLTSLSRGWYLVNIVHNDFQDPDAVFRIFE